jgi:hypothetical protein
LFKNYIPIEAFLCKDCGMIFLKKENKWSWLVLYRDHNNVVIRLLTYVDIFHIIKF